MDVLVENYIPSQWTTSSNLAATLTFKCAGHTWLFLIDNNGALRQSPEDMTQRVRCTWRLGPALLSFTSRSLLCSSWNISALVWCECDGRKDIQYHGSCRMLGSNGRVLQQWLASGPHVLVNQTNDDSSSGSLWSGVALLVCASQRSRYGRGA